MLTPEIVTVIDIETTGLCPSTDHITEIAAIRAEVGAGGLVREIGRFQTFVALPTVNGEAVEIAPEITQLTGIRTEDLRGAPESWGASAALNTFSDGSLVIAHNAPFDFSFIERRWRFPLQPGFVCTRALSRLVNPDESARLADCCARYSIDLTGHHRAMNDVEATLQLYAKLREKAEINGISYRNVVIDSEERPLTYIPPGAIVKRIERKKTEEAA